MNGASPARAFWLETESHIACELARNAGYAIVLFDMEHGVISHTALDRLVPFTQGIGLLAHVRVANSERSTIQHALDAGADAVVIPQIRDLAHAREAAALVKYPPAGKRGIGYSRAMNYANVSDSGLAAENLRRLCYLMIETTGALAVAESIAELSNVDGLFIGPADLSAARGRGAFGATDADLADISRAAEAANAAGKLWAVPALDSRVRQLCHDLGAAYFTAGDDITALARGFRSLLASVE